MEHVLLLNNTFCVDSIKNTWAKAGGTIETPWAICRRLPEHPLCQFGAV